MYGLKGSTTHAIVLAAARLIQHVVRDAGRSEQEKSLVILREANQRIRS